MRLFQAKLELISLSREVAILRSRTEIHLSAEQAAKLLVQMSGKLEPTRLNARVEPLLGMNLDAVPSQGQKKDGSGFFEKTLNSFSGEMLGEKLILSYKFPALGHPGSLWFTEMTLTETLAFKSDPWKNPITKMTTWLMGLF